MAVKFTKNLTEIEIQNPVQSNMYQLKKYQVLGRVASGGVYTYDKGVSTKKLSLTFENLRESEKTVLESFYHTTVNGMMETFSYTDHLETVWTARFLTTELDFEEVDTIEKTGDTYVVDSITYPTTTWEEGIYKVSLELEVST